jgi:hypothetical protein
MAATLDPAVTVVDTNSAAYRAMQTNLTNLQTTLQPRVDGFLKLRGKDQVRAMQMVEADPLLGSWLRLIKEIE